MNLKYLLLLLLVSAFLRCSDSDPLDPGDEQVPVVSSVVVTVVDQSGLPLKDATVRIGGLSGLTDRYGSYFCYNANMWERTHFTVEKPGYFNGSRTLYAKEGSIQYATVTLLDQEEVGTFSSSTGGQIEVDPKSALEFPDDAVVRSDGSSYSGMVHVMAHTIHADDPDLSTKMPGRLEGRNQEGEQGILNSYGMMAVEIQSPSGEVLKVKEGKKVDLHIEVPSDMRAEAPAMIPMWYFDEEVGEWINEGNATFNGTGYETQVSHFSFWNCDEWETSISWESRFVDESGAPVGNVTVCLTIQRTGNRSCDNTNASGEVKGNLPTNELIKMEVHSECGQIIYSNTIGPFSGDATQGPVTVNIPPQTIARVSGYAVNCDGLPVTNGFVLVNVGIKTHVSSIHAADGSFSLKFLNCDLSNASVVVVDGETQKKSDSKYLAYFPEIQAGTLKACDELDEYVILDLEGFEEDMIFYFPSMGINSFDQRTNISVDDVLQMDLEFYFSFAGTIPGQVSDSQFYGSLFLPTGDFVYVIDMEVQLTEYGPVGGYIKGTFNGVVNGGDNGQGGPEYTNFTGSFSVLRTE